MSACDDGSADAGITIWAQLEPLAGVGAAISPPIYPAEERGRPPQYQVDRRWWGVGEERSPVDVVVVDNVPSQANRLEAALRDLRADLGLPEIVLDLSGLTLPPHLPKSLSSFQFPHRHADAYLRDATLDGTEFMRTDEGKSLFSGTADEPDAIIRWFPQALLFGFWQSHLGKKGSQAKLARSWCCPHAGPPGRALPEACRGSRPGLR